ncbi:MAG: PDZ domain-containing protein [Candidatus Bathyarchaeota archaeon]|nr:PDZ domain-containing protein [Candidatus Bathyarchaeota archaeon]
MAGGDVIIEIDDVRIVNSDVMSSYLAQNTLPGETITVTVLRDNQEMDVPLVLGTRPMPSGFVPPSPVPTLSPVSTPSPAGSSPAIPELTVLALILTVALSTSLIVVVIKVKRNSGIELTKRRPD